MIKYVSYAVTFAEVPDEISLTLAISNCGGNCKGCHSPELRRDIGRDLEKDLPALLKKYKDQITCVCFLGQGNDPNTMAECIEYVYRHGLKTCLYTGADYYGDLTNIPYLDYIKVGHYDETLGGLDHYTTNQRMYKIQHVHLPDGLGIISSEPEDITHKFWRNKRRQ
jgi:anaerobic ribonucleoside-triphosphate reductase activating protein